MTVTTTKVRVGTIDFEPGIILDCSAESAEHLDTTIVTFGHSLLGLPEKNEEAVAMLAMIRSGIDDDDTADPWQALHEIADETVDALNAATPDGYAWEIDENSLFLYPIEED